MDELAEIAFFVEDVKETTSFYRALLGAGPVAESDAMAIFMMGSTKIFLHRTYTAAEGELPPENHIAFAVADVDAACRALLEKGLVIEREPDDYYWGRSAYLRDPEGQLIELTEKSEGEEG